MDDELLIPATTHPFLPKNRQLSSQEKMLRIGILIISLCAAALARGQGYTGVHILGFPQADEYDETNSAPIIQLDSFAKAANYYGIGSLPRRQGDILMLGEKCYAYSAFKKAYTFRPGFDIPACGLTYAQVARWKSFELTKDIRDWQGCLHFLDSVMQVQHYSGQTVFRLEGRIKRAKISLPPAFKDSLTHSKREITEKVQTGKIIRQKAEVLGFYRPAIPGAEGGPRLHQPEYQAVLKLKKGKLAGNLLELIPLHGMILYLPELTNP